MTDMITEMSKPVLNEGEENFGNCTVRCDHLEASTSILPMKEG